MIASNIGLAISRCFSRRQPDDAKAGVSIAIMRNQGVAISVLDCPPRAPSVPAVRCNAEARRCWAGQAHEIDGQHRHRQIATHAFKFEDRAGREAQRVLHAKANRLQRRGPFLTDRLPIGHGTDQQPNGLEKVELRGAAEELLLQRRIDMPAFGDFV